MATYIPGIQDYIPQIQPFKPDFNFFQSALEHKQQQYQAGYNKISSIYGQLLNSELLRPDNEKRRDNLFTQIDSDIKRLSGVDLSLQENVYQASKLFQPLIDNPYFRKDIAFTKQYNSQLRKSQGLKNSPDPKSDERWWEEGDRALIFQAEDFSKSGDDDSLRFQNPTYTPFIDTTTKLFKFAADNNINPETLSFDGGYIFKHTNGEKAVPKLQNVFSSVLLSDPRVKAMTYTQSYLDRKNYIKSNSGRFNGDEYAAETEYLNAKVAEINEYYTALSKIDEETNNSINTKKKLIEQKIQTQGVDPDLDKDMVAMYQNLTSDSQVQASVLDKNKSVLTQTTGFDVTGIDRESLRYRVDNALALYGIDDIANKTAQSYAMAKEKIDFQVNPYTLEKVKFGYSKALQDNKFEHDKVLKIMDLATELFKENGNASPGSSLNPTMWEGIPYKIPGPGNVATGVDAQARTANMMSGVQDEGAARTIQNAELFIEQQNAIIADPSKTPVEKAAADQAIMEVLREYTVEEKTPATTKTEDLPTDWGQGLLGLGEYILGSLGVGFGMAGAAIALAGTENMYQGFLGQKTTDVPETVTKTKGLAVKGSDGRWKLANKEQIIGLLDPDSPEYYNQVNQRIVKHISDQIKLNPDNQGIVNAKKVIDENSEKIALGQKLLSLGKDRFAENNKIITSALASEVGTTATNAGLYMTENGLKPRTENEFIAAYIAANKDNDKEYPKTTFMSYALGSITSEFTGDRTYNVSEEERIADMTDDAQELYEELTEGYQTLSKNPDGSLPLKAAFDPSIVNEAGINAYFGIAKMYGFDAAAHQTPAFQMLMDFYSKDFMPNVGSKTFMDDAGVKVGFGNGFDITKDDYAKFESNPGAINALKGFFGSASMNYGGKTGENQQRPTGKYYLHALAAGDANKVAMTVEVDPSWINQNAGDSKKEGIAYDLQQEYNRTGDSSITFFMDADKAQSIGFTSMQSTPVEMLLALGGKLNLDAYSEMGGEITITPGQLGTLNYNGYYKTVDELGKKINNPIFGTTDAGANSLYEQMNKLLQYTSVANMQYQNNLKTSSSNKVYDPQELLNNAE